MATQLTKDMRRAFIHAVMNDVPETDYNDLAYKAVEEMFWHLIPVPIRTLINDGFGDWVRRDQKYIEMPGSLSNFYYLVCREFSKAEWSYLEGLADMKTKQREDRKALQERLSAVIAPITTVEAAIEALPEFEKYWTEPVITTSNLPVLANVVGEFVKAGWPKGQGGESKG